MKIESTKYEISPGIFIWQRQNGNWSCSISGVCYMKLKNISYWESRILRPEFEKRKRFPINTIGLKEACLNACDQMEEWKEIYPDPREEIFTIEEKRRIAAYVIPGEKKSPLAKARRKKFKGKHIKITHEFIQSAMDEYFKNGGKITVLV